MKDLLELLGKRVRELRSVKKWSQEEFAHISGLHRTYVGQIERGEKNISFANLVKISGVLGVTMSELLSGLENNGGDEGLRRPTGASDPKGQRVRRLLDIEKLVKQLRLQQLAVDRTLVSLEELASLGPTRAGTARGRTEKSASSKQ